MNPKGGTDFGIDPRIATFIEMMPRYLLLKRSTYLIFSEMAVQSPSIPV